MSVGKIVGLVSAGVVVVLMIYVMTQGGSTNSSQTTQSDKSTLVTSSSVQQKKPVKSEEELKLEELKEQVEDLSYAKTSKLYASKCSACHGREGEGRILGSAGTKLAPPIKGKSKEYILKKLEDYRQNRVENTLMMGLLTNSSDEELDALAQEIANFK